MTVSANNSTTAAQVKAQLNIHVVDSVSTKTLRYKFTNPTPKAGMKLLNL
jgi:hypothetical protein